MTTGGLRAAYFGAGQAILASEGYGGLKLAAVVGRLGVTTGSFYHSFASWQEYTDALLENWREERTTQLVALARGHAHPVERLRVLARMSADLPHRSEAAIRVWAAVEPRVRAVQERVDDDRRAIVVEALEELVGPEDAAHPAVLAMCTLVGYEMLADRVSPEELAWSLDAILRSAVDGRGRDG